MVKVVKVPMTRIDSSRVAGGRCSSISRIIGAEVVPSTPQVYSESCQAPKMNYFEKNSQRLKYLLKYWLINKINDRLSYDLSYDCTCNAWCSFINSLNPS